MLQIATCDTHFTYLRPAYLLEKHCWVEHAPCIDKDAISSGLSFEILAVSFVGKVLLWVPENMQQDKTGGSWPIRLLGFSQDRRSLGKNMS